MSNTLLTFSNLKFAVKILGHSLSDFQLKNIIALNNLFSVYIYTWSKTKDTYFLSRNFLIKNLISCGLDRTEFLSIEFYWNTIYFFIRKIWIFSTFIYNSFFGIILVIQKYIFSENSENKRQISCTNISWKKHSEL